MKLTAAQQLLLLNIVARPEHVVHEYRPAQRLVELGLAEWGGRSGNLLSPTDAGRREIERGE